MRYLFSLFLLLALLVVPAAGQDAAEVPACDAEQILSFQESAEEYWLAMFDAADAGDVQAWMKAAQNLTMTLDAFDAFCREYTWSSEEDGQQPVIGPVAFPNGVYRARVTTDDFIIVGIEPLDGDCEPDRSLFSLSAEEAGDGAEAVFRSTDCLALLEFDLVSEPWELSFELIAGTED